MFLAHFRRLAVVFVLTTIVAGAQGQHAYKFTPLGQISANYINEYGQVTCNQFATHQVFLWTPTVPNGTSGSFTELSFPDAATAFAVAVNDKGQVIGYHQADSNDYVADSVAFMWTPNVPNGTTGTLFDIAPTLPGPAYGINSNGQVTLGTASLFTGHEVYLWTSNNPNGSIGTTVQLPNFEFHRVNDYGQVGGDGYIQDGLFFPHRVGVWTPTAPNSSTGSFNFIQDLNPDGEQIFGDINSGGQVAGQFVTTVFSGNFYYSHAFLWTPTTPNGATGTTVDIDPVANSSSFALRLNDAGHAVGYFLREGFQGSHGFIYRDGQFIDLNSFVPAGSGISVRTAWGINNKGQIIADGSINGVFTTLLMSPVKSDAEVVELQVDVNTLVINGALLPANGQSLYAKLRAAQQKINNGDNAGAITDLNAFINQVKAFIKTGKISAANGQALIDAANAIINYLKT